MEFIFFAIVAPVVLGFVVFAAVHVGKKVMNWLQDGLD